MRIGKPSVCNECNQKAMVLELRGEGELWSRCLDCGYQEWEWVFGDDPEYLKELAKTYKTTYEEIFRLVRETVAVPTPIQKTIVAQLIGLNPRFVKAYGVRAILWMEDGRTVRLHVKGERTVNIDIIYNRGSDLYEIKAYEVNALKAECRETASKTDVYCNQLDEVINSILKAKR